jgi:hypothetical protein
MTSAVVLSGLWFALATVLLVAGAAKGRNETRFSLHIAQLLPGKAWRTSLPPRYLARAIWLGEVAVGLMMLAVAAHPPPFAAGAVCAIFAAFLATSVLSRRRGMECGCFGAARSRAASWSGVWRSAWLFAASVATVILSAAGTSGVQVSQTGAAAVLAGGFGLLVFGPAGLTAARERRTQLASHAPEHSPGAAEPTRRGFLVRAAALGMAMLASAMSAQTRLARAVPPPPPDCRACYTDCGVCCYPNQICGACCSACYYICDRISHGPCPWRCTKPFSTQACWTC